MIFKDMISFKEAFNKFNILHLRLSEFIIAILYNKIKPCGKIEGPGLTAYMFNRFDIDTYVKSKIKKIKKDDLTIRQLSIRENIDEVSLYSLVNKGFIDVYDSHIKHVGRLITKASIAKFKKKYILSAHLARKFNVSSNTVIKYLTDYNIQPVSSPSVDGGKRYLYLVDDIKKIDFNKVPKRK